MSVSVLVCHSVCVVCSIVYMVVVYMYLERVLVVERGLVGERCSVVERYLMGERGLVVERC